jgi:hypothetical protein
MSGWRYCKTMIMVEVSNWVWYLIAFLYPSGNLCLMEKGTEYRSVAEKAFEYLKHCLCFFVFDFNSICFGRNCLVFSF